MKITTYHTVHLKEEYDLKKIYNRLLNKEYVLKAVNNY